METDIGTRHGFLAALHEMLRPTTYLEVGVQHGTSLGLAVHSANAVGIDPHPLISPTGNQVLFAMTSDEFFAEPRDELVIDLGFIDGMHLAEYAMRDFANIEKHCHPRSVVVFDDVLPRNQHEARRLAPGEPVLGDWTGDVWRVDRVIRFCRNDLTVRLVDVQPTGLLIVTGFGHPKTLSEALWQVAIARRPPEGVTIPVPDEVLSREEAIAPGAALEQLRAELIP